MVILCNALVGKLPVIGKGLAKKSGILAYVCLANVQCYLMVIYATYFDY